MRYHTGIKTVLSRLLCAVLMGGLIVFPVHAALVSTASLVEDNPAVATVEIDRAQIESRLESQLVELGVSPQDAASRLAIMSDDELVALDTALEDAPAGGSILAIAAIVFLVLLFTDIMGYTDLFPFVKKSPDGDRGPVVTEEK